MKGVGKLTEAAFTRMVLRFARLHGWQSSHFRPAMLKNGQWRTAVSGDGKGFPDIVLVRERVIFIELKTESGKLSPEQEQWIAVLKKAKQEVYVWRPNQWQEIERTLTDG